jgi:hypothetical protein
MIGTVIRWSGSSSDIHYTIYDTSQTFVGTTTSLSFDVVSVYPFRTYYVVSTSYNGAISSQSSPVTYLPPPSDLSSIGSVLSWTYPTGVYVTFYVYSSTGGLIGTTTVTYYDTLQTPGSTTYRVVALATTSLSIVSSPYIITIGVSGGGTGGGAGGGGNYDISYVPCFLASAPILTPTGYIKISKLTVGDKVQTADGRTVAIQRITHSCIDASPHVNPYIIPKGLYGATKRLLISPDHRVKTDAGLIEAKHLGLQQESMAGSFDYYNLELPDWKHDNMVVAGVVVESLAPVRRITMTMAQFKAQLIAKYGTITPEVLKMVDRSCRVFANGRVECPVLPT